jgi:hypothetical protein
MAHTMTEALSRMNAMTEAQREKEAETRNG